MTNANLTEFYRGWMFEIVGGEDGFQLIYHSPKGKMMSTCERYSHPFKAWQAGIKFIDYFFACHAIKKALREVYEAGNLEFKEWQILRRSLENHISFGS